jgi:LmbE family N-acetylglucosaminyl deacetylase
MITRRKLADFFRYDLVVVVSPHPDDSCIAVGGLLYRLSRELEGRCQTHVLIMTAGHRGVTDDYLGKLASDPNESSFWSASQRDRILLLLKRPREELSGDERTFLRRCRGEIRQHEVGREAKVLGFVPHCLDLDMYERHTLSDVDEARLSEKLGQLRQEGEDRLLIMPGRNERHPTHRLVVDLVARALRAGHTGAFELWAYDSPWSTLMPRPDIVVALSQVALDAKIEATRCHRSQLDRTRYTGIVEGTAVRTAAILSEWLGAFDVDRALDLGPFAEAFERLTESVVCE